MASSYEQARSMAASRCGVGLGLRWDFLDEVLHGAEAPVAFFEISPENYMHRGGYFPQALDELSTRYEFVTHGLTMSVGAVSPPPEEYLRGLREEIARVRSPWHSDHLCLSTAGPLVLHELLPLALNRATVSRVVDRIRFIEDQLGIPFALENISYYAHPDAPEMSESDFLGEILTRSGAGLLLDVNNVYVNATNHGYDAEAFISALPLDQVVQLHIAGHSTLESPHPAAGTLLDTHGAPVIDPVFDLFRATLRKIGPVPVVLERDNDIPPLPELLREVATLQRIYEETTGTTPGRHRVPAPDQRSVQGESS